jgi:hypothetical protein
MTIEVVSWRSVERGSLKGFAKIRVPQWKLVIDDVAVHSLNGKSWAALPARPVLDPSRQVVRDDSGKVKYAKTLYFDDRATADRFSAAVLEAVKKHAGAETKKPVAEELNDELSDFTI